MSALQAEPLRPQLSTAHSARNLNVRVVFRDSQGQIHLDWPQDKIQDALNDAEAVSYTHLTLPTNREV